MLCRDEESDPNDSDFVDYLSEVILPQSTTIQSKMPAINNMPERSAHELSSHDLAAHELSADGSSSLEDSDDAKEREQEVEEVLCEVPAEDKNKRVVEICFEFRIDNAAGADSFPDHNEILQRWTLVNEGSTRENPRCVYLRMTKSQNSVKGALEAWSDNPLPVREIAQVKAHFRCRTRGNVTARTLVDSIVAGDLQEYNFPDQEHGGDQRFWQ